MTTTTNGWFPRIRRDGAVASGNDGIWITPADIAVAPYLESPIGTGPIWAGGMLVFNRDDGMTDVGGLVLRAGYNDYRGADDGRWAGFVAVGDGRVDVYDGQRLILSTPGICAPRFGGSRTAYLTPYQAIARDLYVDGAVVASGPIMDVVFEPGGAFYVYLVATGTYTRVIVDDAGRGVSLQADEAPLAAFVAPDGTPWLLTGTTINGTFVRPRDGFMGYRIVGDLYYPDARMLGDRLRVVGSTPQGAPRAEWIDFAAPRVDLRSVPPVPPDPPVPPVPPVPPDPPRPPDPPPVDPPDPPPVSTPYRTHKEHSMGDVVGVVRGPGGKLGRPDAPNTGPWAGNGDGWRGLIFDGVDRTDARYHFVRPAATPDALVSAQTGAVAGCDATLHSGALDRQFYLKPDGQTGQGWAERWQFYDGNANGAIEAQVEYAPGSGGDDGAFFSYPLAWEPL